MLNILGRPDRNRTHCDGLSRRGFLKIGGMAAGGLSLAQLLEAEAKAGVGSSHRAIINIFLPGGPSHLDMFDLKPEAPSEIRGEFMPIKTNVPGMEVCELFPRLATMADKFAIIRSVVGSEGGHDCFQCMTGRTHREFAPGDGWPNYGAWVSKLQGPVNATVPANVSLMYPTGNRTWGDPIGGGFIGRAHGPMSLVGKDPNAKADNMTLHGVTLERLRDRNRLRKSLDNFRRDADTNGMMDGLDNYHQQAMGILSSSGLVDAMDLSKEDPRVVARYGENITTYQRDGAPKMVRNFLIARRLVEAGARVVSLNYSRWDWHGGDGMNFPRSRQEHPLLDQGLSALITDLYERGLDKHVSVVMWGEFGRTPKINGNNSRDHWPQVMGALMFGGGMRTGQVVGSTNRYGEHAVERPVTFKEIFATLYHNMGIDPHDSVRDVTGRPHYLIEPGIEPIRELI
jgi:Protein of unknown function (DUF1501)